MWPQYSRALPHQQADRPPQYSTWANFTSISSDEIYSRNFFEEKPDLSLACMDHFNDARSDGVVQVEPQAQSASPVDEQIHQAPVRRQHATRSTPSDQWPDTLRPREFGAFIASNPHIPSIQRTQSTGPALRRDATVPKPAPLRSKRRPRPLDQERLREPPSSTMLYPQLSPYSQPDDSAYATFEYYPRSVSQPVTPGLLNAGSSSHDMYSTPLATSGSALESSRNDTIFPSNDAAFDDEHEFRLFVEATAGLGPIPNIDDQDFYSEPPRSQPMEIRVSHRAEPRPITSPIAETPTTLQALQHLAQMPRSTPSPQSERPPSSRFGTDFEDWLHSPPSQTQARLAQQHSMPHISVHAAPESWHDVPDTDPIEDELPDYAASQAQAQAAQRIEATRRAQELQRRWQASGSQVIRPMHM